MSIHYSLRSASCVTVFHVVSSPGFIYKILRTFQIRLICTTYNSSRICLGLITIIQDVPFIVSPSTAALPHTKHASAGTYLNSCRARGHDKRDILYFVKNTNSEAVYYHAVEFRRYSSVFERPSVRSRATDKHRDVTASFHIY